MTKERTIPTEQEKCLIRFFNMLIRGSGLALIMDGHTPTTDEALCILDAANQHPHSEQVHVQGGSGVSSIQLREEMADDGIYCTLRENGGIGVFVRAFVILRRNDPRAYELLRALNSYKLDYGTIEKMAYALGYADMRDLYRVRKRGLRKAAEIVVKIQLVQHYGRKDGRK